MYCRGMIQYRLVVALKFVGQCDGCGLVFFECVVRMHELPGCMVLGLECGWQES